jgi:hypothetical protein
MSNLGPFATSGQALEFAGCVSKKVSIASVLNIETKGYITAKRYSRKYVFLDG